MLFRSLLSSRGVGIGRDEGARRVEAGRGGALFVLVELWEESRVEGGPHKLIASRFSAQALLAPLRSRSAATIESCTLSLTDDDPDRVQEPGAEGGECRLVIRLHCQHGASCFPARGMRELTAPRPPQASSRLIALRTRTPQCSTPMLLAQSAPRPGLSRARSSRSGKLASFRVYELLFSDLRLTGRTTFISKLGAKAGPRKSLSTVKEASVASRALAEQAGKVSLQWLIP